MARIKSEDLRLNIIVGGEKGRKELQDLQKSIEAGKKSVDLLNKQYQQAVKRFGEASVSAKTLKAELDKQKTSLDAAKKKHSELQSSISLENKTIFELQKHLKNTKIALSKAVPGSQNWQNLSKEVKLTTERLRELKGQSEETGRIISGLGGARGVALLGSLGLSLAGLVRGMTSAVGTMKSFEQANANLATILGKPVREIARLTDNALELGRTTEYTASQVTMLQTELAKLGFSEPQILSMTEPVLHFATAVGADLPEAAAFAGATLRVFNLRAEDTEDLLAAVAVSTNKSALNFSYLQTAMSIVGPVAQSFGFSARDTIALLGSLANAGFDASMAATATRNILLNLANDSGKLASKLGGPVKSLDELIDGLEKLNETGIDLAETLELTGNRSVSAFNSFLTNTDGIRGLRNALEDVNGELGRIAEERLDTFEGSIKKLQSAWEGFVLSMRSGTGILRDLADVATDFLGLITPKSPDEKAVSKFYKEIEKVYKKNGKEAGDEIVADMIRRQQNSMGLALYNLKDENSRIANNIKADVVREADAIVTAANQVMANLYSPPAGWGWTARGSFEQLPKESGNAAAMSTPPPSGGSGNDTDKPTNKSWSLASDTAYQKAKLDLIKQFNAGVIETQEEFDEKLYEVEILTYERRLESGRMSAAERLNVETAYQTAMMKHLKAFADEVAKAEKESADAARKKEEEEKKRREQLAKEAPELIRAVASEEAKARKDREKIKDSALAAEEARYQAERKKFEGHKEALEAVERRHRLNIEKIQLEAFDQELSDIETRHKQKRAAVEASYAGELAEVAKGSGQEAAIRRRMNKELLKADKDFLDQQVILLSSLKTRAGDLGLTLTEDQLNEYKKKLNEVRASIGDTESSLKGLDNSMMSGTGGGSLFGVSQADWEQFFATLGDGEMAAKNLSTAMSAIGGAAKEAVNIASKAIKLMNAKEEESLKQYEKANEDKRQALDKRLAAGLMTQAQYDSEIQAMEDEKAAREEEMKMKQAKREKALSLTQAIINTAMSVTQTIAQWGLPWGLIPAALAAAMGAAEIALIARTPIATGYAEGGLVDTKRRQDGKRYQARLSPNKRGFVSSPTILVGEEGGEYVIPSEGMENPYLAPFINTIEYARRNGTLRSLRIETAQPYISAARASGGTTQGTVGATVVASQDPVMMQLLEKLMFRLENPVAPQIPIAGSRGLKRQLDRYESQRSKGKLG